MTWLLGIGVWCIAIAPAHAETHEELVRQRTSEQRALFVEVERIARLPSADQTAHIPHLYHDLVPALVNRYYPAASVPNHRWLFRDAATLSPEALADQLAGEHGNYPLLYEASRLRCLDLLTEHQQHVKPLVKADLESGNARAVLRALGLLDKLRWTEFVDGVIAVFQQANRHELVETEPPVDDNRPWLTDVAKPTNEGVAALVPYVLRELNDPKAIRVLLDADPHPPVTYFEILRHLCRGRLEDPGLLKLLESPDPEVRWRAAYALEESGDPALLPFVERLTSDPDARVRQAAVEMGRSLPEPAATTIWPRLVALHNDSDRMVRFHVAMMFGSKGDAICATTLHALVTEGALGSGYISTLIQLMHTVTGTYFDYDLSQPPTTQVNRVAMERFAVWIKEHATPSP